MASTIEMTASHRTLSETLKNVRNRWRLKVTLRGIMVIVGAALLAVFVGAWILESYRFSPASVNSVRVGTYTILALLIGWYGIRPLFRRVDEKQVALYLEENEPSLETTVLSAVEVGTLDDSTSLRSSRLFGRIVDMAVARTHAIDGGARVEKSSMMTSLLVIVGTFVIGALVLNMGPQYLRASARLLLTPWSAVSSVNPYAIDVHPGNATVARGGDQTIRVQLRGFHTKEVDLVIQQNDQSKWQRLPMSATQEADVFEIRLLDIKARTTYYVEAYDVRSPQYHLDVVDRPTVRSVSLEYRYPKHTGMATLWIEDGGDIAAPVGTSVIVRAKTTMPVTGARIAMEGQPFVPMTLDPDGTLTGTMIVQESGFYTIELATAGGFVAGTVPYTIVALEDRVPMIAFQKPGRDLQVKTTDEIFSQIKAVDDYGVVAVELRYSVNGGTEQSVPLYASRGRQTEVVTDYTFFLKKFDLKPGDFVSYYAQAVDNDSPISKVAKTDMYFVHILSPEDEKAKQEEKESGEEDNGLNTLSRLQQDIITRTFKAERDQPNISPDEHFERVTTIARSQGELSERINGLVEQFKERRIQAFDSTYRMITKELSTATDAMRAATQQLGNQNLPQALEHEQRALKHLQRAETLFQKRRKEPADSTSVYFKSYEPSTKDLADLFDAEQDSTPRDKANRAAQDTLDDKVDDAIKQIKQLTAEQQQENQKWQQEIQKRQQENPNQLQHPGQSQQKASDGGQNQRQLAQQTEQLARKLQKEGRDNENDNALSASQRELQDAATGMQMMAIGVRDTQRAERIVQQLNLAREILEKRQEKKAEQKSEQNKQKENQKKGDKKGDQKGDKKGDQKGDKKGDQKGDDQEQGQEPGEQSKEALRSIIRAAEKLKTGKADMKVLPKEYAEQRETLEKLQERLKQQGVKTDELDQTVNEMRALENVKTYTDIETVKMLKESIVEGLKKWELTFRRQTATKEALRPVSSGTTDVPSGFKSLVSEYYRLLAKQRRAPAK